MDKEWKKLSRLRFRIWKSVAKQARDDAANACLKNVSAVYIRSSEELKANELLLRRTEDALLHKVANLLK